MDEPSSETDDIRLFEIPGNRVLRLRNLNCAYCSGEFSAELKPTKEHVTWFGQPSKIVSNITLGIIDASTNLLLPLQADFSVELKFYVDVKQ